MFAHAFEHYPGEGAAPTQPNTVRLRR